MHRHFDLDLRVELGSPSEPFLRGATGGQWEFKGSRHLYTDAIDAHVPRFIRVCFDLIRRDLYDELIEVLVSNGLTPRRRHSWRTDAFRPLPVLQGPGCPRTGPLFRRDRTCSRPGSRQLPWGGMEICCASVATPTSLTLARATARSSSS